MFLLYINDINEDITSHVKALQNELHKMSIWAQKWQMSFNQDKCYTLHMYKTHNPLTLDYIMEGVTLKPVSHYPYLGVELQKELKWKTHIDNITSKANRALSLIKRNLNRCSQEIKAKAYTTLVRPKLEYASTVWDPYRKCQINQLEKNPTQSCLDVNNTHLANPPQQKESRKTLGLPQSTTPNRRQFAKVSQHLYSSHQIKQSPSLHSPISKNRRIHLSTHSE